MVVTHHHSLQDLGPVHPPQIRNLGTTDHTSNARRVEIKVKDPLDHDAPAIVHEPPSFDPEKAQGAAVVLVSGAGGGVSGPSGIYPSLAEKFALLLGIPCLRLDYREPAAADYCTADVLASFTFLRRHFESTKFLLVGWSFGGSPCFTVGGLRNLNGEVRGVATVASQTAGTAGIRKLNPRPVLLLHGTADKCLSPACSQRLYDEYGSGGKRSLHFFQGDDHGLSKNAAEVEKMVFDFAADCLGFQGTFERDEQVEERAGRDLAGSRTERLREMHEGHDLEGGERL